MDEGCACRRQASRLTAPPPRRSNLPRSARGRAGPGAMVAFAGALNVTTTVSSGSSSASPVTVTSMARLVIPAAKVSVPAVRVV